jgi:hypothetical protein
MKTFLEMHGSKMKNIALLFLGAALGIVGKTYADNRKTSRLVR